MGELDRLRERVRQTRTVLERQLNRYTGTPACPESALGCTFLPGDRVFDRVTGEEGVVLGGQRETLVVSAPGRSDG